LLLYAYCIKEAALHPHKMVQFSSSVEKVGLGVEKGGALQVNAGYGRSGL
jgi:hypothetical protein